MSRIARRRLASFGLLVAFFAAWEVLCIGLGISEIVLPRPTQIVAAMVLRWEAIQLHTLHTAYTTLVGFALGVALGVVVGAAIGSSKMLFDVAYPLLIGFSSIPKVAVVPIFVLWFGAGATPSILTAMIMAVFPVTVNVATGLATTEPELEDLMRTLRASRLESLWNVGLPRTMPYFFASLNIAVTLALVGAVISETIASNRGIGNLMVVAGSNFDTPFVFAGLFVLAAMGVALYYGFALFEKRIAGWALRKSSHAVS